MIKKVFFLFLFCLSHLCVCSQTRVSVYVADTAQAIGQYRKALTNNIYNYLTKSKDYIPINRSASIDNALFDVRNRQQNGNVDFSQAVSTTKEYGESHLLFVEVIEYKSDKTIEFDAQLIDVEKNTPTISAVAYLNQEKLSIENILDISQKLLIGLGISSDNSKQIINIEEQKKEQDKKKSKQKTTVNRDAIIASTFIPGAGQFYKENNRDGALFLCSELILVGGGTTCYFLEKKQRQYIKDNYYSLNGTEIDNLNKIASIYNISMYACFGLAAAIHIGNMIHAWYTPDKKDRSGTSFNILPAIIPTNEFLSPSYAMGAGIQIKF